ncbi:DUF6387 family protein [Klebsiella pneumoniae]|uniref:DUF6387 family protein n=1 Tax=Klebsiella pneumoniae TaxID=573 RepID=UPI0034D4EA63
MRNASKKKLSIDNDGKASLVNYYSQVLSRSQCEAYKGKPEELNWFKIKNYDFVNEMPFSKLIRELIARVNLGIIANTDSEYGIVTIDLFRELYSRIIDGQPVISGYFISDKKHPEIIYPKLNVGSDARKFILSEDPMPVRELSIRDINECYDAISVADKPIFSVTEDFTHPCYLGFTKKEDVGLDTLLTTLQEQNRGIEQIYLSVNPYCSESEILSSFQEILSLHRKHKMLSDRKILNIRLHDTLPLLDLVIWQIKNKKQLPLWQIYNLLKGLPVDLAQKNTDFNSRVFSNTVLKTFGSVLGQGTFVPLLDILREKKDGYNLNLKKVQSGT